MLFNFCSMVLFCFTLMEIRKRALSKCIMYVLGGSLSTGFSCTASLVALFVPC